MSTNLSELLNELDSSDQTLSHHEIWMKIYPLKLERPTFEAEAEMMAFCISEVKGNDTQSEWKFFYPYTTTNGIDGIVEYPKLEEITEGMIDYWKVRSGITNNLYMKVRYTGLVFVFEKIVLNRFNFNFAVSYINLLIEISSKLTYTTHELIKYAKRALILAKEISNKSLINKCISNLISIENNISNINIAYTWGFCFETLIIRKEKNLTEIQKSEIIKDMEENVNRFIDNVEFPYLMRGRVELLADYYRSQGDVKKIKDILSKYKLKVDLYLKKVRPIIAHSELNDLYTLFKKNNMHIEAQEVLVELTKLGYAVMNDFHQFEVKEQISSEDMIQMIKENTDGDFEKTLLKLILRNVISKKYILEQIENKKNKFPMMRIFSQQVNIDNNGRVVSKIDADNDQESLVWFEMKNFISLNCSLFDFFLRTIIDKNNKTCSDLVNYIYQSALFKIENREIIFKGVEAFLIGNHIVCVHLLIPQIECAFRNAVKINSGNILNENRNNGFNFQTLDGLISHDLIKEIYNNDEDIIFYFRSVLSEPRGLNIRNDVCHGILGANQIDFSYSLLVMHIILLLAQIKDSPVRQDH